MSTRKNEFILCHLIEQLVVDLFSVSGENRAVFASVLAVGKVLPHEQKTN